MATIQRLHLLPVFGVLALSCGGLGAAASSDVAPGPAKGMNPEMQPLTEVQTVTSTRGRVLVRDAELGFEVSTKDEQSALRTRVIGACNKLGGYVSGEYEHTLTMRVPSKELEAAVEILEGLGKVTSKSVHVEEVTGQHTDLSIRIDNARRLRARLQALLAEAKTVPEMLEVEKELSRVTEELERYEGQLRVLDNRVSLSTLTVTINQVVRPGPIGWVFYGLYKGVTWLFVWN